MPFPSSSFVQSGRFSDVRLLGRGAGGQVYYARDNLGRAVAVKEVLPSARHFEDLCDKLQKEAQIQAALQHPNIVHVYHLEQESDNGERYLVCEYLPGGSLADHLKQHGPLAQAEAIEVALAICAALDAISAQRIVHRDIKPSNILLVKDEQARIVSAKLGDFGVAQDKRLPATTHLPGMIHHPGTPEYMAPEQADITQPVDVRTDLYALGISLWEMLTGTDYKLLARQGAGATLALYNQPANVGLEEIIAHAAQAERGLRYPTPQAMAYELKEVRDGTWKPNRSTITLGARHEPGASRRFERELQPAYSRVWPKLVPQRMIALLALVLALLILSFWLTGQAARLAGQTTGATPQPLAPLITTVLAERPTAEPSPTKLAKNPPAEPTSMPIAAMERPTVEPAPTPTLSAESPAAEPTAVPLTPTTLAATTLVEPPIALPTSTIAQESSASCLKQQLDLPQVPEIAVGPPIQASARVGSREQAQNMQRIASWTTASRPYQVIFSPDGQTVAAALDGGMIQLWRTNGQPLRTLCLPDGDDAGVLRVIFTPDGQTLVAASGAGVLQAWRVGDGALLYTHALPIQDVVQLAFAPDGQALVTSADQGRMVQLFRVEDGTLLRTLIWNASGAMSLAFSPDGNLLLVGAAVGSIGLMRVNDSTGVLGAGSGLPQGAAPELGFAPNGQTFVLGLADGSVQIWRLDGKPILVVNLPPAAATATVAYLPPPTPSNDQEFVQVPIYPAFAPDSQSIAAALSDGTIKVWQISDGALLRTLTDVPGRGHTSLDFTADGKLLAIGRESGTIELWGVSR
jgi:serine/threonine protein kinase/WD40 repeat protein